jgi:His-Xaa-Ser system protein HxsD
MEAIGRQEETDRRSYQSEVAEGVRSEGVPPVSEWTFGGTRAALRIDLSIYTVEATLRACYKFTDRCYVFVARDHESEEQLLAVLTAKAPGVDLAAIVGEFGNELLDQRIRGSLDAEFGPLRTLIVAQAFSEGNLLDLARTDGSSETASR